MSRRGARASTGALSPGRRPGQCGPGRGTSPGTSRRGPLPGAGGGGVAVEGEGQVGGGTWVGGGALLLGVTWGGRLAPHRVHHGAGQDQGTAAGGVAMGAVQAAGPQVRGFQVGGDPAAVQGRVVSAQQRGAQSVALPVRADGQQGQVVVGGPGGVAAVPFLVKGPEPAGPGTGDGGEPLIVALGQRAEQVSHEAHIQTRSFSSNSLPMPRCSCRMISEGRVLASFATGQP